MQSIFQTSSSQQMCLTFARTSFFVTLECRRRGEGEGEGRRESNYSQHSVSRLVLLPKKKITNSHVINDLEFNVVFSILCNANGNKKSKMAAYKQETCHSSLYILQRSLVCRSCTIPLTVPTHVFQDYRIFTGAIHTVL